MNSRLKALIDSANMSDCRTGCERLKTNECTILVDWGWTHAIQIPTGFLCEIENTGWFFCETEAEAISSLEAE